MIDRFLYRVRGQSMIPTFQNGDVLLVGRTSSAKEPINRGSNVIVQDSGDEHTLRLKRIIGLPGEELSLSEGLLFIDGKHLSEPYLGGLPAYLGTDEFQWKLSKQEYFVMGDNRVHSTDSRHNGPVPIEGLLGIVKLRIWPLNRLSGMKKVSYNQ